MSADKTPLRWLHRLAQALNQEQGDVRAILRAGLRVSARGVRAEQGCILTFADDGAIEHAFLLGFETSEATERDVWNRLIQRGLIGFVYHGQRTVSIRDTSADPRWQQGQTDGTLPQIGSALGVPLLGRQRPYGVLVLTHPTVEYFDQDTVGTVEMMAMLTAGALDSAEGIAAAGRYRQMFDETPVPMLLTDLRGTILDANARACALFCRERDAILSESVMSVMRISADAMSADSLRSADTGHEIAFSTEALTAAGENVPILARARRLLIEGEDRLLWVTEGAAVPDEREQLRRDLTAMTYHDLRGPLHNINGSLARLEGVIGDNAEPITRGLLHVALNSTRQLTRMVKSLLDIERLEAGKAVLDRKPALITELMAEAADVTEPLADDADQKIVMQIADNLPLLTVDGDMIARVITNLVENAVKYTPAGGQIIVSAQATRGGVVVSVRDYGPGMSADVQAFIFDKYTRVRYKGAPSGLGLGLAFCRLAVEAHGGRIWVESEPGRGSVFHFTLPVVAQPAQALP